MALRVDYEQQGRAYARFRQSDPRIAQRIHDAVDAAMACVTIHHWEPPESGLAEMRRVARSRVVVFTFELDGLPAWQQDYLAQGLTIERPRFPSSERIADALGGRVRIEHVPTPGDCVDGFFEAFWRPPRGAA
jgi:hypothetical protein